MPVIWGQHNNSQVFLDLGIVDASTASLLTAPPVGAPIPNPTMFKALIDTGAQRTMISSNVIKALAMNPVGKIPIQGVGPNVTYHDGYLFHVVFVVPFAPSQQPAPGAQVQVVLFTQPTAIYGAEITSTGGMFDVLLGMDVLSTGSLKIEGNGTYSFAF